MADEQAETTTTEAPAETPAPDLSEQMADLGARFDKWEASQNPPEPEPEPTDILSEYDFGTDDGEPAYQEPVYQEPAADPRIDQLYEWATQREQESMTKGLHDLAEKYDDFRDKVPQISQALDDMGITDPAQRGNAKLAERVYKSLKAEADADAETPAEEARSRGARIETGASAGAPPSEEDPYAQFIEDFGKGRESSVF